MSADDCAHPHKQGLKLTWRCIDCGREWPRTGMAAELDSMPVPPEVALRSELRLDLEPVVHAMAREQAGIMGLDLDRCEPAAVERLKQQLLGALVAGLPALLGQLQAQGWAPVATMSDDQLADLELVRAAPVQLPPATVPCTGLNGTCFLDHGHDGEHLPPF